MSSNNFNPEQWHDHVSKWKASVARVTPSPTGTKSTKKSSTKKGK